MVPRPDIPKEWPEDISSGYLHWCENFVYRTDSENFGAREYQSFGKRVGEKVYGDCDEMAMGGAKVFYPKSFWRSLFRRDIDYITCRHDPEGQSGPNNHARLGVKINGKKYYLCNIDPTPREHPYGPNGQFLQIRRRGFVEVLDRFVTSKVIGRVVYGFTYLSLSVLVTSIILVIR